MRSERVDEVLLTDYLLGNLSEEEEARVEDNAFADPNYLGVLEATEADLIDTYVRGGLSQSERRAFERRFLTSPKRRSQVEFARALARVAAESPEPIRPVSRPTWFSFITGSSPALRFAAGFAALICIAAPSWLIFQNAAMRSRVAVLESQRRELETNEQGLRRQLSEEENRSGALAAELQQQPPRSKAPVIASLVLLSGVSRAETRIEQLVLNPSAQIAHIEIQLEARDDYRRFRAELRTRRGEEVLTRNNLPRRRASAGYGISFDVPASALSVGEYELALKGVAGDQTAVDIGYYYFGVRKQ
jgi:hypothetical protein